MFVPGHLLADRPPLHCRRQQRLGSRLFRPVRASAADTHNTGAEIPFGAPEADLGVEFARNSIGFRWTVLKWYRVRVFSYMLSSYN